jgi:hypothetical protein
MTKELFLKIVDKLNKDCLDVDDFSYIDDDGKIYTFEEDFEAWTADGKYQTRLEKGILVECDNKFKTIQKFNYGVQRCNCRTGSYYTEWNYEPDAYDAFEIKEITVPEVIIPAHTEEEWVEIK